MIQAHVDDYNAPPNEEVIKIQIEKVRDIGDDERAILNALVDEIVSDPVPSELDWILDEAEKWCKDRALSNAIFRSIKIYTGEDKSNGPNTIAKFVEEALGVSFMANLGHDWEEDAQERFKLYHQEYNRIPIDIEMIKKATRGGWPRKTLNMVVAPVNMGKTLFLCHSAVAAAEAGYNVVYFTLEASTGEIGKRIDANILDVTTVDMEEWEEDVYLRAINQKKHRGKIIIKEYPTVSAGAAHFKAFLNELRLKKNGFKPDLVIIDYLNICISTKLKGGTFNSYTYIKAISEELRGMAVEMDVAVLTASQLNRTGSGDSDPEMTDIADSYGTAMTADFIIVLTDNEELRKLDRIMIKKLKSRYSDPNEDRRFLVGINRAKQRLFDVANVPPEELAPRTIEEIYNDHEGKDPKLDVDRLRKLWNKKDAPDDIEV